MRNFLTPQSNAYVWLRCTSCNGAVELLCILDDEVGPAPAYDCPYCREHNACSFGAAISKVQRREDERHHVNA